MRILPFFWACTLAYNTLSWAGSGHASIATMARTMVLWPLGELRPNVAWSLRHELIFYVLFTSCLLPMGKAWAGRRWLIVAPWCLAPLVWSQTQAGQTPGHDLLQLLLGGGESGANLQFGAGLLIGLIHLRRPAWLDRLPVIQLWHLCLLFALFAGIVQVTDLPPGLARITLWTMLAAILILGGARTMAGPGIADRTALALGNSSFSLYLMHNTVMLLILSLAMRLHLRLDGMPALAGFLLFCVTASLVSCHILYLYGERPLVRSAKKMLARWKGAQPKAA